MFTNQHSFAIGIPTINQWDLLKPSIEKYIISFPNTDIWIVDNGHQDIKFWEHNVHVVNNCNAKSVAASWNQLCRFIFLAHKNAIILNDDVCLEQSEKKIDDLLRLHADARFFLASSGWHSFMMPKQTFHFIGPFDENFKGAYFEDNDYWRRLMMADVEVFRSSLLSPVVLGESMSITKDPSLNKNHQANFEYYKKKWGGSPGGETFTKPFNGR